MASVSNANREDAMSSQSKRQDALLSPRLQQSAIKMLEERSKASRAASDLRSAAPSHKSMASRMKEVSTYSRTSEKVHSQISRK